MSRYNRLALATIGTLLLTLFATPLAYAESGSDDSGSGSGSSSSSGSDSDSVSGGSSDSESDDVTESPSMGNDVSGETESETPSQHREDARKHAGEIREKAEGFKAKAEERQKQNKEHAGKRLEANKLRVCEKRETIINKLMVKIGDRGQKHFDLITKISDRVQAYKIDKNLTVADYDALVAAVATQKTAAQTAVDAAKSVQASFKCDGSDPVGAASTFKDAMKTRNQALKAYRDSVIDLLKAVKHSQGDSKSDDDNKTSPSPIPEPAPASNETESNT
jgi:hypothetical protein